MLYVAKAIAPWRSISLEIDFKLLLPLFSTFSCLYCFRLCLILRACTIFPTSNSHLPLASIRNNCTPRRAPLVRVNDTARVDTVASPITVRVHLPGYSDSAPVIAIISERSTAAKVVVFSLSPFVPAVHAESVNTGWRAPGATRPTTG